MEILGNQTSSELETSIWPLSQGAEGSPSWDLHFPFNFITFHSNFSENRKENRSANVKFAIFISKRAGLKNSHFSLIFPFFTTISFGWGSFHWAFFVGWKETSWDVTGTQVSGEVGWCLSFRLQFKQFSWRLEGDSTWDNHLGLTFHCDFAVDRKEGWTGNLKFSLWDELGSLFIEFWGGGAGMGSELES